MLTNIVSLKNAGGIATQTHRVIAQISEKNSSLLSAAEKKEFNNAVAYLIRRLDEQSSEENFLRHSLNMIADSPSFDQQVDFQKSGNDFASVIAI